MSASRELALELYRRMAPRYDRGGARWPFAGLRRRTVDLLDLAPGDAVLDVGCGTGLALPLLEEAVGPEGRIIAIDQSPDMLALARGRAGTHGWQNVTFIQSSIEEAAIPSQGDAALFAFSHDIIRSPQAVENAVQHLKPGGHVAVVGVAWGRWWELPFSLMLWLNLRRGATTYEGLGRPWSHLERLVPRLQVRRAFGGRHGCYYLGWGRVPG